MKCLNSMKLKKHQSYEGNEPMNSNYVLAVFGLCVACVGGCLLDALPISGTVMLVGGFISMLPYYKEWKEDQDE